MNEQLLVAIVMLSESNDGGVEREELFLDLPLKNIGEMWRIVT